MLSKNKRIDKVLFKKVFERGRVFDEEHIFAKVLNISDPEKRFSFTVPSKTTKSAVKRNLMKRRGKHVIGVNINNIKSGFAVSFFFKNNSTNLKYSEIKNEVIKILKKANLCENLKKDAK